MKTIKQGDDNTCGQCCVAMLTDRSRQDVFAIIGRGYTDTSMIRKALAKLGYSSGSRLVPFRGNKNYGSYRDLPHDAILKLKAPHHKGGSFHWVVWDSTARKRRDPKPIPYKIPPCRIVSYLVVQAR